MPTPFSLTRRIEDLEAESAEKSAQLVGSIARVRREQGKRWRFLCETVAGESSYPENGDTFAIRFLDAEWEPTEGTSGFVRRYRSENYQAIAKHLSGEFLPLGTLCEAEYQPAPPGTSEKGRWIIIPVSTKEEEVVFFRLTAALGCGGTAAAQKQEYNPVTGLFEDAGAIIVKDEYGDMPGNVGYKGWAKQVVSLAQYRDSTPVNPVYSIIYLDHQAIFIEFSLQAAWSYVAGTYQASALVTAWYQGQRPTIDDNTPLVVYDPQRFFPRAQIGAKGKAVWSQCEQKYRVYECQQMTRLISGQLSQTICPDDTDIPIEGLFIEEFSPFNQGPPAPQLLGNALFKLAGQAGDWAVATWFESENAYQLTQVQHKKAKFITQTRYNDQLCRLEQKRWEIAFMSCQDEGDWELMIQLTAQDYLTNIRAHSAAEYGASAGSCSIQTEFSTVCGFGTPKPNGYFDAITFSPQQVIVDVYTAGGAIWQEYVTVFVLCTEDPGIDLIIDGDDCPPQPYGS